MSNLPTVSVLIVNWNGKTQLEMSLPALKKARYPHLEIIIVDNASTDKSILLVKDFFPHAKIIHNQKNEGFAEGCNIGIKEATGKYVLLLNNDVQVTPNFLILLVEQMERDEKLAGIQPKILFSETKKLQAGASYLTYSGFLYHYGYNKNPNDKKYCRPLYVFSANGCCLLLRKKVIDKIGLFDSNFFAYFEETDFCWRAWLSGFRFLYYPESKVYHKGAQTSRKLPSTFIYFHSYKNRINSLIKNLDTKNLLLILPIHLILCEFFAVFSIFSQKKLIFFVAIQKAVAWNLFQLSATLSKRRFVQSVVRIKQDKELFPFILQNTDLQYYRFLAGDLSKYPDKDLVDSQKSL